MGEDDFSGLGEAMYLVYDARSNSWLVNNNYPALWTSFKNEATRFTQEQLTAMYEQWPYLLGCDTEKVSD